MRSIRAFHVELPRRLEQAMAEVVPECFFNLSDTFAQVLETVYLDAIGHTTDAGAARIASEILDDSDIHGGELNTNNTSPFAGTTVRPNRAVGYVEFSIDWAGSTSYYFEVGRSLGFEYIEIIVS